MGKKSKRQRPSKLAAGSRREEIAARHEAARNGGAPIISMDPRAKADHHKQDFIRMTEDGNFNEYLRFMQLKAYCDAFVDIFVKDMQAASSIPTDQDHNFLKTVCKSNTEKSMNKAQAYWTRCVVYTKNGGLEDACQCVRKAIQTCNNASNQERQQDWGGGFQCGDYHHHLEKLKEICQEYLDYYGEFKLQSLDPVSGQPIDICVHGGDQCDLCGKSLEETGLAKLDCCSFCKLTYYCSRDCQKKDWKSHKQVCRKPGEFKVGDVVCYDTTKDELLGPGKYEAVACPLTDHFQIIASVPGALNAESWLVTPYEVPDQDTFADTGVLLETKHLRRCRPALWHCFHKNDVVATADYAQYFEKAKKDLQG